MIKNDFLHGRITQQVSDADGNTIIPKGEAALVTNQMAELVLLIPDTAPDEPVPEIVLYLAACMIRCTRDPDFVREQIEWINETRVDA